MAKTIQIRADILFQIAYESLSESVHYRFFNLNEFLARVEKVTGDETKEIRYGVMFDFEGDESPYDKSYLLEIPAKEIDPIKRKEEQEGVINQYIDEMRGKFKNFYEKTIRTETIDEFDKMARRRESADGLWSILREFRKSHMVPFLTWLFKNKFSEDVNQNPLLTMSRMTFECDREYYISTDWSVPYICYEKEFLVSHFKAAQKSEKLYYPFHNYAWQDIKLCTTFKAERDTNYAESYVKGVSLKPNNYALFAYYTFLIDNICSLQQENYDTVKEYYAYTVTLTEIQRVMLKQGPLSKFSERQLEKMDFGDSSDWDGDTSDDWWGGNNKRDFALGMSDLAAINQIFSEVLVQESKTGRNANRSVEIESLAYALFKALLENDFAKNNYTDLWAHNDDVFAYDLIHRKSMNILSQMSCAKEIYNKHLVENLYEHTTLEEAQKGANKNLLDPAEWSNIFYRSNVITFETWINFYGIREEYLKGHATMQFNTKVVGTIPHAGDIARWITETAVFPNAVANSSTPSQLYDEWKLSDPQTRKLANYLMGGGKEAQLVEIEEKLVVEIKRLFGTVNFKEVPFDRIDELHEILLKYRRDLVTAHIPTANTTKLGHTTNLGASALNLYLTKLAFDNANAPAATTETKLRAYTVALGLFSDVANTAARYWGVQATLSRSIAMKAGGRMALSLGFAQTAVGGVGGILGVLWFGWDSFQAGNKGFRSDAMLDFISAVGCGVAALGLAFDSTIALIPVGVVLNIVGATILLSAQALKFLRAFSSIPQDYCLHLFGESLEKGGVSRISHWKNELKEGKVSLPLDNFIIRDLEKLTERVVEFMADTDTYDNLREFSN